MRNAELESILLLGGLHARPATNPRREEPILPVDNRCLPKEGYR